MRERARGGDVVSNVDINMSRSYIQSTHVDVVHTYMYLQSPSSEVVIESSMNHRKYPPIHWNTITSVCTISCDCHVNIMCLSCDYNISCDLVKHGSNITLQHTVMWATGVM